MATRLKPSRINVDNTPRVGEGASYKTDDDFHWSMGGGDMAYEDFAWNTLTGDSVVIEKPSNNITPSGDFTVSAGTVKPGIVYTLRVNSGSTPYTMTLGTGISNPSGYSTTLNPNSVNQFQFIATADNQLELEGVDSAFVTVNTNQNISGTKTFTTEPVLPNKTAPATNSGTKPATEKQVYDVAQELNNVVKLTGDQTVNGTKTFGTSPVVPNKTTDATNTGTAIATEAQVYKKANKVSSATADHLASLTSGGDLADSGIAKSTVELNTNKETGDTPTDSTSKYPSSHTVKKYVDDQVSAATAGAVSNEAYDATTWDAVTGIAPSKNAVRDKIVSMDSNISGNSSDISTINGKIPSAASTSNQLADKAFVNSSINSIAAYYITKNAAGDQFATYAELAAATTFYSGGQVRVPTMNDYCIVQADENHDNATTRYIYNNGWEYQYTINETPLTQAQLDAINSGITAGKVSTYDGYATGKQDKLTLPSSVGSGNAVVFGANNKTLNDAGAAPVLVSGNQTINGTKTFGNSPVVPSKTADATNTGTAVATEAQVYKKQDKLTSGTNIKTVNNESLLGSGNIQIDAVIKSATAPASATEGDLWYDTTNDKLKAYDGSAWQIVGDGDVKYSDFSWQTKTGAAITMDLACTITPSANFTVNAPATIRDGQSYILRVNNGATAYTMTLGTNMTNPYNTDLTLTANGIDQFVFLAIGGNLELQPEGGSGQGLQLAPNSPLKPKYLWVGTKDQYTALTQYYTYTPGDTEYHTI